MSVNLSPEPILRFVDNSGVALSGGTLSTYQSGTNVPAPVYTDSTGSTQHANPITLNTRGEVATATGVSCGLWIPPNTAYKFVLADSLGNQIWSADPVTDVQTLLTQSTVGAALWPRTADEVTASVTPIYYYYQPGDVRRYGADVTGVADSSAAISNADLVGSVTGASVYFPSGIFRCANGFTKKTGANWYGAGKYVTTLKYYGSGTFINAVGTNVSVATRIICTIADMTLDGTNATGNAQCLTMGWNQRSNPFLRGVRLYNFPHYGIHFTDWNWNVDFNDVEVDTCGRTTTNSSGIFKDASVDPGVFNAITFNNLQVESCGNTSSTAGGVWLPTTTSNRGIYFNDCIIEGNYGTLQIYITNTADVQFNNLYMEGDTVPKTTGQTYFIELDNCKGGFRGGFLSGNSTTAPKGILLKSASEYGLQDMTFSSWATTGLEVQGSTARLGHNMGITFLLDATAQLWGEVCPRFSAHKNAVNQTGIVTAVFTKVTFSTEEYDETGAFASSTLTPQVVGRLQLDAAVTWTTAVDQTQLIISIYRSGSAYKSRQYQANGAGTQTVAISALVDCRNSTDTFEIYVRQSSGSNKDISGATDETYFMGTLVK